MEALEAPPLSATIAETLGHMVDALVGIDAMVSGLMGARTELLNDMRAWGEVMEAASEHSTPTSRDLSRRSLRAEVACALRLPERTVESLLATSRILVSQLPDTVAALKAGRVTYQHAQVIADDAAGLSPTHATALERLALPVAQTSTVAVLRNKSRALREVLCPETIAERTAAAAEAREVSWQSGRDGMGWLSHYLSAVDGLAIMSRADDAASRLKTTTEPRTQTQLRSDVLRDAMLDGAAATSIPIRPDVYVTVPVFTLMGLTEQPASLEGYGPIDAETARRLVANATGLPGS